MGGNILTKHNLPALDSRRRVTTLAVADRDAYFDGYYPGQHRPMVAERTRRILLAVGVWV